MNREAWYAVIGAFLVVGLLGFFTYIRYEQPEFTGKTVTGKVLRHDQGRTGKTGADPCFVVELPDGRQVSVRDKGELPVTYRGPVEILVGKSNTTGLARYAIAEDAHNKSLQPMR